MIVWHTHQTGDHVLPQMLRLVIIRRANLAGFRHIVEDSNGSSLKGPILEWQIRVFFKKNWQKLLATKLFTFRSSEMYTGIFLRSSTGFTEFRQFRDAQAVHSEYRVVKRVTWLHFAHQKLLFDHAIVTLKSQGDSHNNTKFLCYVQSPTSSMGPFFSFTSLVFLASSQNQAPLGHRLPPTEFHYRVCLSLPWEEWNGSKIVGHSQIAKISIHQIICWNPHWISRVPNCEECRLQRLSAVLRLLLPFVHILRLLKMERPRKQILHKFQSSPYLGALQFLISEVKNVSKRS